jgi:hypothetical protein
MQIRFLHRFAVIGLICITSANASAGFATITALTPPVWLQQEDRKSRLDRNSELKIGDTVSTGETGRVQMMFWEHASLQLNTNSAITLLMEDSADAAGSESLPEIYIHQGRVCIDYTAQPGSNKLFKVNMGDTMFAVIHNYGDICLLRSEGQNFIKLRAGSVQITQAIVTDMIILSETGSEIHMEESGSYRLLFPGGELSAIEIEKPFIVETGGDPATSNDLQEATDIAVLPKTEPKITATNERSAYVYTVYLFSTRDEDVAQETNQRFLKAGHDTQIIESTSGSIKRYRVAATGFDSSQAAKDFSNSVVGKYGVTETWIGRDLQPLFAGESSAIESEKPSVIETEGEPVTPTDIQEANDIAVLPQTELETTAKDEGPAYVYTVYLFSTRDEDVAQETNQRFLKAGHDTQIIESTSGSIKRYRVAATGFDSSQAAKDFSNSVVGKYGVTETWIGRNPR